MHHRYGKGFTLLEIMIVVAIIGLLAAIAVPNFVKARLQSQTNACIDNLRQIESGKEQSALEYDLANGVTISVASVNTYLKGNTTPVCPAGGSYAYNVLGTNATCNITNHALPF